MKAVMSADEFKRIVNNTKKFTRISGNGLMEYIYLEVDAEAKEIKATALNGYAVSIERAKVWKADESFKCFIKPTIPKITKHDLKAELELVDGKLFVTVGDSIMDYIQPKGEYYKVAQLVKNTESEDIQASIWVDPALLKAALESVNTGYRQAVKIEIRSKKMPVVIRSGNRKELNNIKLVLPVNISEEA